MLTSSLEVSKGAHFSEVKEPVMRDFYSGPRVVVGVDGSRGASQAAVWAVAEAVSRDIPLRLAYVIDPMDLSGVDPDDRQFVAARALHDAQRAVEATGEPVKIETEILVGKPVAKLAEESRSAAMVCVGSVGMKHACGDVGSVAAALPALARCPVAVIRQSVGPPNPDVGSVVAQVDNGVVLRHAFEEARLRGATLRAVVSWRGDARDSAADGRYLARARLNRRIARWERLYPDVRVEPTVARGSVCRYLAENARSVQLFVTSADRSSCDIGKPGPLQFAVLTVRSNHL